MLWTLVEVCVNPGGTPPEADPNLQPNEDSVCENT